MKSIINALKKEGKRDPPELHWSRTGNWRVLQVAPRSAWTFFRFFFKFTYLLLILISQFSRRCARMSSRRGGVCARASVRSYTRMRLFTFLIATTITININIIIHI